MAPLQSGLFKDDAALQAAADRNPAHIVEGASGFHVAKIQAALLLLDEDAEILFKEFVAGFYGSSTADAVLAYKTRREIINRDYQQTADNIVGIRTTAAMDKELLDNKVASILCDPGERQRIQLLLNANRPNANKMISTMLKSIPECREVFELDIIDPARSLQLRRRNRFTLDGLKRFFSVDRDNQSQFLPDILKHYEKYNNKLSRLASDQFPAEFLRFLKDFRDALSIPKDQKKIKGKQFVQGMPGAFSSKSPRGMFFLPGYRVFDKTLPAAVGGLFPSALAGIQVHEMGHFYFDFVDGDPRGKPTRECLTITQSHDLTARQAAFEQTLAS
jgi:hypothetical protein